MSMPGFFEIPFVSSRANSAHPELRPQDCSPLVSVAVAMTVVGCLLATANPSALERLPWIIGLLAFAIEEEVRSYDVPKWYSALVLITWLGAVALGHGTPDFLLCVAGAMITAALLLPLYGGGLVRSGTLIACATFGAIAGVKAVPPVLLIAAAVGIPLALVQIARDSGPRTVPVLVTIGFAAAAYPLL